MTRGHFRYTYCLTLAIKHRVNVNTVLDIADKIEHEGKIVFKEIDSLSNELQNLIVDVHEAVAKDQVRRGLIKDGEESKVIPREKFPHE